jgi:uncharacterized delta-60 repeat protein
MIKVNSNSLNLKGGKTLVGDFEYEIINSPFTFNNSVDTIIQQSDGKIVAGGGFTEYSGSFINRIARINSDGTIDSTFNVGTGFNSFAVYSIIQQSDGKIVAGGDFTTYSGSTSNYIVRINSDGTKDTTFNVGTGFNASPAIIIQQSDGKLVVGGDFTTYSGSTSPQIVRINSNGTKDTTFNVGAGYFIIYAIAQQPDNKLIIAGWNFYRLNSNGTQDTTFVTGFLDSPINDLILQSDGKIVAGGGFTEYSGSFINRIARINSDGTIDSTFNVGTGFNNTVTSVIQQSDGKIVAGGLFTTYSGSTSNYIVRINSDGTKDTTFNVGTGFNDWVYTIIQQSDGKLVVGGNFYNYSGSVAERMVLINPDGTIGGQTRRIN